MEIYRTQLGALSEAVRKTSEEVHLKEKTSIMHALCEVVAEVASDNEMGFEEYLRCAICAWDCCNERMSAAHLDGRGDSDGSN